MNKKVSWCGQLVSVQPRIRLHRSFDQRTHSYLGYVLLIHGGIDNQADHFAGHFRVAIGKAAHGKHHFRAGDQVSGKAEPVPDKKLETADYYKASGFKIIKHADHSKTDNASGVTSDDAPGMPSGKASCGASEAPPWLIEAPDLKVYQQRGHRRLHPPIYDKNCVSCVWGCRMPVEITIDQWDPRKRRYRFETFCYGPKSCPAYRAGATRKVPGRKGMTWEEADWVDEDSTAHRGRDE